MESFKIVTVIALLCMVGTLTCREQKRDFDDDIKEACSLEFKVPEGSRDKNEKAEQLPENVQCYMKCLLVKSAARNGGGSNFADSGKSFKEPEIREQFAKCAAEMKDESCMAFASFMICMESGMKV